MNNIVHQILIIDDDPDIRKSLTTLFEAEHYEVESCANAAEAIGYLSKKLYSTILVDIFLPDINGIDFIDQIKQRGIRTPIIIITGNSEIELARKALRLDVFDYLVKPFKGLQLQQVVRNAVLQNNLIEEQESLDKQKAFYQQELEKMVEQKISQLRESELKYQNLVEQSLFGVFIIQDDLFRFANQKLLELLECGLNEIMNQKSLVDYVDIEHRQLVQSNFSLCLSGEKVPGAFKFTAITGKTNLRVLEVWIGLVQYSGRPAIEGIVLDFTEQNQFKIRERQLELELMNEHKLAVYGRLAVGIAHNLNTPISIIQGNAELLQLRQPDAVELQKILKQTGRMSELISTILKKGRQEQTQKIIEFDLNDLLRQELDFLNANLYFKHHIEKEYHFAEDLPLIKGVYSDFSQSIMNIIQNAIDAVFQAPVRKITITTEKALNCVLLHVRDTGSGIKEEDRSRIFDPFFTTKPAAASAGQDLQNPHGIGLGLSLVDILLTPYGVKIDVDSEATKGSLFTLRIPVNTSYGNASGGKV